MLGQAQVGHGVVQKELQQQSIACRPNTAVMVLHHHLLHLFHSVIHCGGNDVGSDDGLQQGKGGCGLGMLLQVCSDQDKKALDLLMAWAKPLS